MPTLAERFGDARKAAKISQYALAKRVGISSTYIQKIENGEITRPAYDRLVLLADALAVSVDFLLGMDEIEGDEWDRLAMFYRSLGLTPEDEADLRDIGEAFAARRTLAKQRQRASGVAPGEGAGGDPEEATGPDTMKLRMVAEDPEGYHF